MWLTIRSGEDRGKTAHVAGERFLVGRDEECDLVLGDPKVSRRHVSLKRLPDGRVALQDLGSGNGTFVNGERVQSATLGGDEQIQVGETVLVSSESPPGEDSGQTVIGSGAPRQTQSAVQRLLLQRSVRRATLLSGAAVVLAGVLAALFATGVLPPGGDTEEAVQRVVKAAAPSTVLIEGGNERGGTGTGWVLDAEVGLVVTNAHVVDGGGTPTVVVGGERRDAQLVGMAPCEDLAVLRVRKNAGLRTLPLGNQSALELGETVVAVGFPSNASLEANLTSTTGVVSVVRSSYREAALDIPRYPNVIQTDAAINPGNSGGPLLNLDGKLIGVNSAGRTLSPTGRIVQGQSYAIGVDRVKEITAVLRDGRSIAWTGASFDYPTPDELERRRLPPGLEIARATAGTAADRAGLDGGGGLLVAVNGQPVRNSLASYCDAVGALASGTRVTFSVLEPGAGSAKDVELSLE